MEPKVDYKALDWKTGNVKGFSGKQLIDQDNGTVKLVRVDPQSNYPLHRHPDKTEYAYVVEGNFEFIVGDKTYDGVPGDFLVFPLMTMHAIHNKTDKAGTLLIGAIMKNK